MQWGLYLFYECTLRRIPAYHMKCDGGSNSLAGFQYSSQESVSEIDQNNWIDVCRAVELGQAQKAILAPNMRYNVLSFLISWLDVSSSLEARVHQSQDNSAESDICGLDERIRRTCINGKA